METYLTKNEISDFSKMNLQIVNLSLLKNDSYDVYSYCN
jgi:uncharacterized protein YfkK (UPF0435 family)